jgi:hypothetical protein
MAGLALPPGLALAQATDEPPPAPTDEPAPPPDTPRPPEPGPATAPATARPVATARPPAPADDDEDDAPPPAAPGPSEEGATPEARPTRTRRPTRTPRTTPTSSPTPPVAGGLRLSLAAEPAMPILRERATFVIELANQGPDDAGGLTLDILIPDVLLDYSAETRLGETAQAGSLLRWYIPELPRESRASLRIVGTVARTGGGETRLCALLISAGAPIEHCSVFGVLASRSEGEGAAAPTVPVELDLPTAEPAGSLIEEAPRALASGWGLLLAGFIIMGAWLGLQLRSGAKPE